MKLHRFTKVLIKPSYLSSLVTFIISSLVLVISELSYATHSGLLYEYLFGTSSSSQLIQTSTSSVDAFTDTIFGNAKLNNILFFAAWMLIGLTVYLVIVGFGSSFSFAEKSMHELHYVNVRRKIMEDSLRHKLSLQALIALLWFIYSVVFLKVLLPFSILSGRIGVSNLYVPTGWFYTSLALFVLIISIHLHVILLRLFVLRPRVYGGTDDILMEKK